MKAIPPILPTLWAFTIGLLSAAICAAQTPAASDPSASATGAKSATDIATHWNQTTNGNSPPAPDAQALLADAIRVLQGRTSVSAHIRQTVDLFGNQLTGFGSYREQRLGSDHLIRLELKLRLGEQTSSFLQVCDGRYLWTHRTLLDDGQLSRIDVDKVRQALEESERTGGKGDLGMMLGLGGLPKLLRGLHDSFEFSSAQAGRWGKQKRPVWRLEGRWKKKYLLKVLPDQRKHIKAGKQPDLSRLPEHLPDHVVLMLAQEDGFPYRIEYRRALPKAEIRADGPTSKALVTMELNEVVLDARIDPQRFMYNPGNLEPEDKTDEFLKSLGLRK